jgi:branched-chain amino acid aminotransferase
MILPGITRDSVLSLARAHSTGTHKLPALPQKLIVTERSVSMKEVKTAAENGSLVELFGSGTAAVITTVDKIGYLGEDVLIPTGEDGMGPLSRVLWRELVGRQTGTIPSEWSAVVDQ